MALKLTLYEGFALMRTMSMAVSSFSGLKRAYCSANVNNREDHYKGNKAIGIIARNESRTNQQEAETSML